jgi:voltage-gated potassium channel Kch
VRGERRFSQAISEGDGISLLAEVTGADAARTAESVGAEGIVVRAGVVGLRNATELPILWYGGSADESADACVVEIEDDDVERTFEDALAGGLDCVVAVLDEDQLQVALDRLDPEIFLLRGRDLEQVLGLLPDVPAGKLAIAELAVSGRDEVEELERAGIDAVIVPAAAVERLAGES